MWKTKVYDLHHSQGEAVGTYTTRFNTICNTVDPASGSIGASVLAVFVSAHKKHLRTAPVAAEPKAERPND